MSITFTINDVTIPLSTPPEGAVCVEVPNESCPKCGDEVLQLRGPKPVQVAPGCIESPAETWCCKAIVGTLRVERSTIFGYEEDDAVLNGRARGYG